METQAGVQVATSHPGKGLWWVWTPGERRRLVLMAIALGWFLVGLWLGIEIGKRFVPVYPPGIASVHWDDKEVVVMAQDGDIYAIGDHEVARQIRGGVVNVFLPGFKLIAAAQRESALAQPWVR